MKKAKIIVWSIVTLVLIALLVLLFCLPGISPINIIAGWSYRYEDADSYTAGSGDFPADGITSLDIDWVEGSVHLLPSDDGNIHVEETSLLSLDKPENRVHTRLSNGTLTVKYAKSGKLQAGMKKTLTVRVPASLHLATLKVTTVSASLDLRGATSEKVSLSTTSGDIRVEGTNANTFTVDTTSGGVTLSNVTCRALDVDTTSGDMMLDGISCETLLTDSTSGSLRFEGKAITVHSDTTSGSVRLVPDASVITEIDVDSTSGDVTVVLPAGAGFAASLDSVSGDFSGNFDARSNGGIYVYGDGKISISVDSVSGNLRIERAR